MTAIIGGKSCRSCEFMVLIGKGIFCRRYPPMAFGLVTPGPQGRPAFTVQSSYPPVNPELPCGEYQRSELNAGAELRGARPGNGEIAVGAIA